MGDSPAEERKVMGMKEVTIKIDDDIYEFYQAIADEHNGMSVEDVIVEAIQECFEGEICSSTRTI